MPIASERPVARRHGCRAFGRWQDQAEALVAPTRACRVEDMLAVLVRLGVADLPLGDGAAAKLAQFRAEVA